MDIRQFLSYILPHEGVYYAIAIRPDGRVAHVPCEGIDTLASKLLQLDRTPGLSVYHACAAYRNPWLQTGNRKSYRKSANWLSAKALWVDVDVGPEKAQKGAGYATRAEAMNAIVEFCKKHALPQPLVISSGLGFHVYWALTEAIAPARWQPMATMLKSLLSADGVLADPSRTADFASILRPVGTHHRKTATPIEVKAINKTLPPCTSVEVMEGLLRSASEKTGCTLPAPVDPIGEVPPWLQGATVTPLAVNYVEYRHSAELCAQACRQVAQVAETQGDASYEHWRGVIGLLTMCEDGLDYARKWTERRAETGHTNIDYETRYETWDSGPTTCEFFQKCNPEGCKNCPHKGHIASPIMLARLPEDTDEAEMPEIVIEEESRTVLTPDEDEKPQLPEGYAWKNGSLIRYVQNKDGVLEGHIFSKTLFYVAKPIVSEEGTYEFLVRWFHPKSNKPGSFRLSGDIIGAGGTTLAKELGRYSINITNNKTAILDMTSFLKDSVGTVMRTSDEVNTFSTFGWQKDHSFVIGDRHFIPKAEPTKVLLEGGAKTAAKRFPGTAGTLEAYCENLNWLYNHPGMEPMQYAICSLWGSLLVPFADAVYNGIPCVLSGASSGRGKTTAGKVALYAFGDAEQLTLSSDKGATQNARTALLGIFKNLPLLFDEMTNIMPRELSALLYSLSSGVDRARLQASNGTVRFADQEQWASQSVLTSNNRITSQLAVNNNAEAEAMRVFEIRVDTYDIPQLDVLEFNAHVNELAENYGCAGELYIQYLVDHRKDVAQRVKDYFKTFDSSEQIVQDQKLRFYRNHIVCTMVAAEIMTELGVIQFNLEALRKFALEAVNKLIQDVLDNTPKGIDLMRQMLNDMEDTTLETLTYPVGSGKPELCGGRSDFPHIRGAINVRRITGEPSANNPYGRCVMVAINAVRSWLSDHRGMDIELLAKQLREHKGGNVLKERSARCSLGKGVQGLGTAQERVWILDLTLLAPDLFGGGDER